MSAERLALVYTDNGPLRPDIHEPACPDLTYTEHEVDSGLADCECEGPECDPETCPRFGSECSSCGSRVPSGDGVVLMDGGEVFGECCIDWIDAPSGPEHEPACPRARFWDAGEFEAPCSCRGAA